MKGFKLYILTFFAGLFTLFIVTLLLLPTIASSNFGKEKIEHYINSQITGNVSFENLKFSFLGSQDIQGMEFRDLSGRSILKLDQASIDLSFPRMLFQGIKSGSFKFADLNATLHGPDLINTSLKNVSGEFQAFPLQLKLRGLSAQGELDGFFDIDIALNGISFEDLSYLSDHPEILFNETTDFKAKANLKNFPVLVLDTLFESTNPKFEKGFLTSLLGNKLDLTMDKVKLEKRDSLTLNLQSLSPNITANIQGEIGLDKLFITSPGTIMFMANQDLLEHLFKENLSFSLKNPTSVLIALDEFSLPFSFKNGEYDISKMMFKGRIDCDEAELISNTNLPDIFLKKFNANVNSEIGSDKLHLKVQAEAIQANKPIQVALETTLPKSLDFKKHKIPPMRLNLTQIPVALIDQFFGGKINLSKAIGAFANLKIEALMKKNQLNFLAKFESDKLSIPALQFKLDNDLTLTEPATIYYKLEPTVAKKLLPENAFLSLNTDKPLSLTFFVHPIVNIQNLECLPENLAGELYMDNVTFNVKDKNKTISYQSIYIPWEINTIENVVRLNFSGFAEYATGGQLQNNKKGSYTGTAFLKKGADRIFFDVALKQENASGHKSDLKFHGDVSDLLTEDKALNLFGLGLNLDAQINNMPTPLFCKVACLDKNLHKKIEVLFGKTLNANMHVAVKALDGLVQAKVNGEEGSLNLDSFAKDGFLFLNKPFQAQFKVTPRLGTSILQDIFPILSGVQTSDQPILISIENNGFSFPLHKLDVTKIEMPKATLSLGHVKFDKSGELATILSLLTPSNSELISVWFTPLYFSMHEGVFRLERVDLLISNQFPIATWGKVDLIKDKVRMMIGMSGQALTHAFKIKGLEDDYMLQIPFIGKTNSATIDKPTATARIGALIAQGQGGPKGLVLGTVLSLAGGALSEKRPPKPTTSPLPWEESLKQAQKNDIPDEIEQSNIHVEAVPEPKKKRNKKFNLDKAIEQNAGKLIEHIFKN